MQTMQKKLWISALFDYVMLAAFFYYLIVLRKPYFFSVGGTLTFLTVIGINKYFSFVYKKFYFELTLVSSILFFLMALNYFAYHEYYRGFSDAIAAAIFILIVLLVSATFYLSLMSFKARENDSSHTEVELRKRISFILFHLFFIVLTATFATWPMLSVAVEKGFLYKLPMFYFSNLAVMWLIIGLLVVLIYMKKWSYLEDYVCALVEKKSQLNITDIKRVFYAIAIVTLIAGSVIEMQRGFWFLWFCSWFSFVLIMTFIWKMWRFAFLNVTFNVNEIELAKVKMLPSIFEPKYFFKVIIITALLGTCYIILFIFYAAFH